MQLNPSSIHLFSTSMERMSYFQPDTMDHRAAGISLPALRSWPGFVRMLSTGSFSQCQAMFCVQVHLVWAGSRAGMCCVLPWKNCEAFLKGKEGTSIPGTAGSRDRSMGLSSNQALGFLSCLYRGPTVCFIAYRSDLRLRPI